MFRVKGTQLTVEQLDLWVRRREEMVVAQYRQLIWVTLRELVMTTPQWSGHAAANWNIGIGMPDNEVHDESFKGLDIPMGTPPRQVGHPDAWRAVSERHGGGPGGPFMRQIKRRTKVYFSNGVYGDRRWGDGAAIYYLAELQSGGWPWQQQLREENRPYETAEMVIRRMDRQWREASSSPGIAGLGFGRMGGVSFDAEFV